MASGYIARIAFLILSTMEETIIQAKPGVLQLAVFALRFLQFDGNAILVVNRPDGAVRKERSMAVRQWGFAFGDAF